MATLFISDLHLTPHRPRIRELFHEFLDQEAKHAEALYILGDLFDYWIGDDAAAHLGHDATLRTLRELTERGTPTYFLTGNRDFLIGNQFCLETGCILLKEPTIVDLYGLPVLLMHGDSLCTDDTAHQRFRAMVDKSTWRDAFLAKPIEERMRLAMDARTQSDLHKSLMTMEIMDVNQGAVEKIMRASGVTVLIHGHTHRPAIHEFRLDGVAVRRIVLGDWHEHSSVLKYSQDEVELTP